MNVSIDDLLKIIGEKEVTIILLKSELAKLQAELAKKDDENHKYGQDFTDSME